MPPLQTTDSGPERRVLTSGGEMRSAGPMKLAGYAALYETETTIGSMFRERLASGAFASALHRRDDVRALFNHDANIVLGRTTSGTLRLSEDARGLRYELDLPDTSDARNLWALVQRGDVSQSSFAFSVDTEDWPTVRSGDLPLRVVKSVHLFDVSPVTYPAYAETSVSARARQHVQQLRGDTDWRAELATRRAAVELAEVNAPAWLRNMPECFRRDPRSAQAWAASSHLQHLNTQRNRAASQARR